MSIKFIREESAAIRKYKINLRSEDRASGTSSNFTINLPTTLNNIVMIEKLNIFFPYTFFNITSSNNVFRFTDASSTARTLTVDPGFYDIVNLMKTITRGMNRLSGTVDYNYSLRDNDVPQSSLYTRIYNESGENFQLNFSNTTNSIANVLGYNDIEYTGASTYTAPHFPRLIITKNVFIECPELTTGSFDNEVTTNSNINNLLFRLNNINQFGEYSDNDFTKSSERYIRNNISSLSSLTILVKDDAGNIIDLNDFELNINLIIYTKETTRFTI